MVQRPGFNTEPVHGRQSKSVFVQAYLVFNRTFKRQATLRTKFHLRCARTINHQNQRVRLARRRFKSQCRWLARCITYDVKLCVWRAVIDADRIGLASTNKRGVKLDDSARKSFAATPFSFTVTADLRIENIGDRVRDMWYVNDRWVR